MRRLLVCLALAGSVTPAIACLNDEELPTHEREFRSQYRGPARLASARSDVPASYWLWIGGGAALATGAVALALTNTRARG